MSNRTHKTNRIYGARATHWFSFLFAVFAMVFVFNLNILTAQAAILSRPPNNLGLVGYWPLDEKTGMLAGDFSGNGNNGAMQNFISSDWVSGKKGYALNLNNGNEYVQINSTLGISSNYFTIAAWINTTNDTSPSSVNDVFDFTLSSSATNRRGMQIFNNTVCALLTNATRDCGTKTVNDGKWHHIAVVFASDNSRSVYVDGIQDGATFTSNSAFPTIDRAAIGVDWDTVPAAYFLGKIDDVRVYSRPLSSAEIFALYKSGQVTVKIVSNSSLAGYWSFNEGVGSQAGDFSGNNNIGTLQSGAFWRAGKFGKAVEFDGSDDYVQVGNPASLQITGDLSLCAWLYPKAASKFILAKTNSTDYDYGLYINGSRFLTFFYGASSASANSSALNLNSWSHVCTSLSGTNLTFYVNGQSAGTASGVSLTNNGRTLAIGRQGSSAGFPWSGYIDEVRIYSRALTSAEVLKLYSQDEVKINSSQNNLLTSGLVGFWSFNGPDYNSASTTAEVLDRSGYGNNGDAQSGPVLTAGKVGQGIDFRQVGQVSIASSSVLNNMTQLTYCAWLRPRTFGIVNYGFIFSKGFTRYFAVSNSNKLTLNINHNDGGLSKTSTNSISMNVWNHLCASWTGGNSVSSIALYVNGAEISGSGTDRAGSAVSDSGVSLISQTGRELDGILDEVRVYNRVLSASEIKQLYDMGR